MGYIATISKKSGFRKKYPLLHCYIATLLQSSRKRVLLHCYIATISKKMGFRKKIPPATLLLCYNSSCPKKNLSATLLHCYTATILKKKGSAALLQSPKKGVSEKKYPLLH